MPSDKPNGVSIQVHRLANALVERGHRITCISYSPKPEGALYECVQLSFKGTSKVLQKFNPAVRFMNIRASGFDVLHYHGDDYFVPNEKRRIRTFYGSALNESFHARKAARFLYQGLFYLFEWISCFNFGIKVGISKATCKALPLVNKVIPCGVPLDLFKPGKHKTDRPSILFLGDLGGRKRGDFLINLFNNNIINKYPDCRLTIVGPEPCEGENIRYLSKVSEDDLISEYQKAWIYCMPSSYEGFGVPAIESMACGTAVVACNNQGIKEIIKPQYNGIISNDNDLADIMNRLISDNMLREKLVQGGRETVAREYDIKSIAARYEELYLILAHLE